MPRLGGKRLLIAAAAVGILFWGAWRLLRPVKDRTAELLGRLPADQALHLYIEMDALLASPAARPMFADVFARHPDWETLASQVDAVAVSLGESEIFLVLSGVFPEPLIAAWLADIGADCPASPSEDACSLPFRSASGMFSLRLLDGETLALADSPHPQAVNRLAPLTSRSASGLAGRARARLNAGAFAWMNVDAPLLADAMREPPKDWINLSLVARALIGADRSAFSLADTGEASSGGSLLIGLEAECKDEAAAAELQDVLGSLNKMARGALGMDGEPDPDWLAVVDSFGTETAGGRVSASWRIDSALLRVRGSE